MIKDSFYGYFIKSWKQRKTLLEFVFKKDYETKLKDYPKTLKEYYYEEGGCRDLLYFLEEIPSGKQKDIADLLTFHIAEYFCNYNESKKNKKTRGTRQLNADLKLLKGLVNLFNESTEENNLFQRDEEAIHKTETVIKIISDLSNSMVDIKNGCKIDELFCFRNNSEIEILSSRYYKQLPSKQILENILFNINSTYKLNATDDITALIIAIQYPT